ncbi:MAG: hypothetical protein C0481_18465 [Phenylobacterium sp.]|uniref:hypothetical protein n=1 Tax=Phenylobacterium sp. TaxID=1871053 RepID=UPI0025F74DCC|nr:hypothetical protein [Phenylobacterium sp.]MBA4013851.1 hypothetical protein [Phenylobacterium sp.]
MGDDGDGRGSGSRRRACQRLHSISSARATDGGREAEALYRHAAHVDLVKITAVEAVAPENLAGATAAAAGEGGNSYDYYLEIISGYAPATYHYRVLERLKGDLPPDDFTLQGMTQQVLADDAAQAARPIPHKRPPFFAEPIEEATAANLARPTCALYPYGWMGSTAVVFRDADGALLGAVVPHRRTGQALPGRTYAIVDGDKDRWLAEVRTARRLAQQKGGRNPAPFRH